MDRVVCECYYLTQPNCGSGYRLIGTLTFNEGMPLFCGDTSKLAEVCGIVSDGFEAAMKLLDIVVPSNERNPIVHAEFCKQLGLQAPYSNRWEMFERQWEYYMQHITTASEPLCFPGGILFWRELPYEVR